MRVQPTVVKHLFFFILPGLWLVPAPWLKAQQASLLGRVVDTEDSQPLYGATVALYAWPDTASVRYGAQTDSLGLFHLAGIPAGTYSLRIRYPGYRTGAVDRLPLDSQLVELGTLPLPRAEYTLEDIQVQGQRNPVEAKGDTVQFNASAFKVHQDATVEDLVRKMPGVVVVNGEVQAQGERVQQVLVDGKPFLGTDAKAALKNLPAESVQSVQVYDDRSDRAKFTGFDDGENQKTLNIITKPAYRNGSLGRAYAGGGTNERYSAGGLYSYMHGRTRLFAIGQFNNINTQNFAISDLVGSGTPNFGGGQRDRGSISGGNVTNVSDFLVTTRQGISTTNALGLNFVDQWGSRMAVSGSYFFNESRTQAERRTRRQFVLPDAEGQTYTAQESALTQDYNHRLNLRLDWTLDSANSILFQPRLTLQRKQGGSLLTATTQRLAQQLSSQRNDRNTRLDALQTEGSLLYRHKFGRQGRTLSAETEWNHSPTWGNSRLLNNLAGNQTADTVDQQQELDQYALSLTETLEYTEPLGRHSQLSLEYQLGHQQSEADRNTRTPLEGQYLLLDTALTNRFDSRYLKHRPGLAYLWSSDKLNLSLGMRYQWAELQANQQFPLQGSLRQQWSNLLPYARLKYNWTKTTNLRIYYRSNTETPTVSQLQDVVDNSNPLQLKTGNPALRQANEHRLFAMFHRVDPTKGRALFAMLRASTTLGYIGTETTTAQEATTLGGIALQPGAQLSRYANLDGYYSLRSFVSWSTPLDSFRYNVNVRLGGTYVRTPGRTNGQLNYSQAPTYTLGLGLGSNISPNLDFNLESSSSLNYVYNSLNTRLNTRYFSQGTTFRLRWQFWRGFFVETEATHSYYDGLGPGFDQNFVLWNAGLGRQFGKKRQAELKISAYDLLNENNSVQRSTTDIYIEDETTRVLQQYFLCTFTWRFTTFSGSSAEPRHPPGGMPQFGH